MRGVGKQFGGVWACRGVDLTILAGEVHAVLGENGAGKSTLMKILHGVYVPDEGSIEVNEQTLTFASPRSAEAAGIAMIPQELDLFPDLSVCENLYVGRTRPRTRFGAFDWAAMRKEARGSSTSSVWISMFARRSALCPRRAPRWWRSRAPSSATRGLC